MGKNPEKPARRDAVLIRMSDVAAEPVEWLWMDRIAMGKTSMILGDPDLGKSFVTLEIAARVSTGTAFPDSPNVPNPVGSVILLSAEDDPADTIRPRLDAAGADSSKIHLLKMIRTYHEETGEVMERSFSLERDLAVLKPVLAELSDCRLIIIDPVSAYLGSVDSNKNADIRGLLAPLAQLAADHRLAVVMVTHLNKGSGGKAMYRGQASIAFNASARSAWLVVQDKENAARRMILPVKNNLTAERSGLAYSIKQNGDGMGIVQWETAPVTMHADDALAKLIPSNTKSTALGEAVDWLRDQLRDGARPANAVREAAKKDGIKDRTLDRAKRELKVVATRDGFGGPWVWMLPEHRSAPTDPEERQHNCMAHNGKFGALRGGVPDSELATPQNPPSIPVTPLMRAAALDLLANDSAKTNPAQAEEYRRQAAAIRNLLAGKGGDTP
jgi:hypothetical protein